MGPRRGRADTLPLVGSICLDAVSHNKRFVTLPGCKIVLSPRRCAVVTHTMDTDTSPPTPDDSTRTRNMSADEKNFNQDSMTGSDSGGLNSGLA